MSVNLCIDWGNSAVKAAIFENDRIYKQVVFSREAALEKVSELMDTHRPVKGILCSVVNDHDELKYYIKSKINSFSELSGHSRLPINNAYLSADTLGPDRLGLVCGAHGMFPEKNNLVISLG